MKASRPPSLPLRCRCVVVVAFELTTLSVACLQHKCAGEAWIADAAVTSIVSSGSSRVSTTPRLRMRHRLGMSKPQLIVGACMDVMGTELFGLRGMFGSLRARLKCTSTEGVPCTRLLLIDGDVDTFDTTGSAVTRALEPRAVLRTTDDVRTHHTRTPDADVVHRLSDARVDVMLVRAHLRVLFV